MKHIIIPILTMFSAFASAQIIIGDETGTATNKNSVLLEFSKTQNKGLILPYVQTLPTSPAEGTILLDASNSATAKVKYYNGSWVDLSYDTADISNHLNIQPKAKTDADTAKVIIGAGNSTADGILVLESTTKAMVLPKVNSTDDIINPAPGMMVYVANTTTSEKLLAVFNGANWTYLAPQP